MALFGLAQDTLPHHERFFLSPFALSCVEGLCDFRRYRPDHSKLTTLCWSRCDPGGGLRHDVWPFRCWPVMGNSPAGIFMAQLLWLRSGRVCGSIAAVPRIIQS